jgi:hypothetical protein
MKKYGFQPGAVRRASKNVSSPTSRPEMRVMPCARSSAASAWRFSVERVGSP